MKGERHYTLSDVYVKVTQLIFLLKTAAAKAQETAPALANK